MNWISRKSYILYFYTCFIFFLGVRFSDGLFLTQIATNPIRSPRVDLIVWTTQALGIPNVFSSPYLCIFFDLLIALIPFIILYQAMKKRVNHRVIALHAILFLLYILIIYCFPTLSIRKYLGLVLIPFVFIFSRKDRYEIGLELMRYYVLFIFTSASLWKIVRGVAWDSHHMQWSLKGQHIDNFIHWPDHIVTQLVGTIIYDPFYCSLLFGAAVLSQLAFAIGFFTKKYDKLIAFLLILFILSDFLVMRIEYWEFIVFIPLFFRFYPKSE